MQRLSNHPRYAANLNMKAINFSNHSLWTSYPGDFTFHVGKNGPGLSLSHDTLNFGGFSMIIYIGEFNLRNSYAVSRFVDHLIDILKIYSLSKEHSYDVIVV